MDKQQVQIYDSIFATETTNQIHQIVERWLKDEAHRRPQLTHSNYHQWKVTTNPTTNSQQRGLTDCGIYAITFLHLLAQNQPTNIIEHEDIKDIREILHHTVLEDELDHYSIPEEEEEEEDEELQILDRQ
jgi:Ulp1 family protease